MNMTRILCTVQAVVLLLVTTLGTAQAAVVSTADYLANESRAGQLSTVEAALARRDVQQQLEALGIPPEQALARVAALSPAELQLLHNKLGELPAGGSFLGLVGAVFIVLLILEIVGVTDIFSKV